MLPIQSDNIEELMKALSKVQGEICPATKDSDNPYHKSKYADLTTVWDACRASLRLHGLAVTQTVMADDTHFGVLVTTLGHESGQWMRSYTKLLIPMAVEKNGVTYPPKIDSQTYGSAITYMRRYALAAIVGVVSADDDGGAASNQGIGVERADTLRRVIGDNKKLMANTIDFLKTKKIDDFRDIPVALYFKLLERSFRINLFPQEETKPIVLRNDIPEETYE